MDSIKLLDLWTPEYYYIHMPKLPDILASRGLSQADVARGTGLDTKTIWHVIHGHYPTRKSTRQSIARFLGMAPEDIFFPSDYSSIHKESA